MLDETSQRYAVFQDPVCTITYSVYPMVKWGLEAHTTKLKGVPRNLAHVTCILIVDDSPLIRRTLRALLEQTGNVVCGEAENGMEAVERAQQLKPDLIVLDLTMPVMNGLEAARKLKQVLPAIPLVLFTNHASPQLNAEATAAGIALVRNKSEGVELLVNTIYALLKAA